MTRQRTMSGVGQLMAASYPDSNWRTPYCSRFPDKQSRKLAVLILYHGHQPRTIRATPFGSGADSPESAWSGQRCDRW
jgi:hypothetical protein